MRGRSGDPRGGAGDARARVGINVLPHAVAELELAELGLLARLDEVEVRTRELIAHSPAWRGCVSIRRARAPAVIGAGGLQKIWPYSTLIA